MAQFDIPAEAPADPSEINLGQVGGVNEPPKMLRMFDPSAGTYGEVPHTAVQDALKDGLQPAWSEGESALAGASQGLTLGYGDELAGAAKAGAQAIGDRSLEGFGEHYRQNRDDARDQLAEAQTQNPKSYLAGQVGGALPLAAVAPAGITGGAAFGALSGLGSSQADLTKGQVGQAVKDTAIGGAVGAAIPAALQSAKGAPAAFAPQLRAGAERSLLSGAGIGSRDLGVASQVEANQVARAALDTPGLVPGIREGATAPNLARNAGAAVEAAGQRMGDVHNTFDVAHGPTIGAQQLAQAMRSATQEAVRVNPTLKGQLAKAIRLIDSDAFDAAADQVRQLRATGNVTEARRLAEQITREPWSILDPAKKLTQAETQKVITSLKGLGAHGPTPTGAEFAARKDIMTPAWNAGASEIRGAASTFGGPKALQAEEAARAHYSNMIKLKEGADAAEARQLAQPAEGLVSKVAKGVGKLALGVMTGSPAAGSALAGAGPTAGMIAPRIAPTLEAASKISPQVGPAAQKLATSYGSVFASQPPERRAVLSHQLMEMSPRFRKLVQEANAEKKSQ